MPLTHKWRILLVLLGVTQLSLSASLRLYGNDDMTLQTYEEAPLFLATRLLRNKYYDSTRLNLFHIFGFEGKKNGTATVSLLKTFISLKSYNVFLLNWEREASGITISAETAPITNQIAYVLFGVGQAFNVGIQFGKALLRMATLNGLDLLRTIITGHSLGAQLAGIAGRTVRSTTFTIGRIIGLDPAGPLFGNPPLLPSLSGSDAVAVLCLHTDPGDYGNNETQCTVDVMVNYEYFTLPNGEDRVQPGCPVGHFRKFSENDMCSHNLCWKLLIKSILNSPMKACKADNVWDFKRSLRDCFDNVEISLNWNIKKSGVYFMDTDSALYEQGIGCCPGV